MTSIPTSRSSNPMNESDHTPIMVRVFGRTDVGRTREHNEDAFVVADLTRDDASLQPSVREHRVGTKGSLFMVADGMGGAAAGEIASQMATEIVLRELRENWIPLQQPSPEAFARCLKRAALIANDQIHGYAISHQEYRGMGTTATIAGLLGDTLYIAQVGDSRGYLIRDGVARQITKDQSLMQKLIEAGELTEEEAAQSERRNIILQALGPEAVIKVDLTYQRVRRGDILVLCSDGLSGQVTKDDISRVVQQEKDPVKACRKLIQQANEAGGPDNITVIIAKFEGEGLNVDAEGDDVGHHVFALAEPGQPSQFDKTGETEQPLLGGGLPPSDPVDPLAAGGRSSAPVVRSNIWQDIADTSFARATPAASTPPPVTPVTADLSSESDVEGVGSGVTSPASPKRRTRGIAIAIVLLALMIAFGTWYALRTVEKVQPDNAPAATRP